MSKEWPGSEKPVDTTEPIFVACVNDPVHMEAYAKVEAAEAHYALHNRKSDPLFRDALNAVRSARRTFRMKVNYLYMQVEPTLPRVRTQYEIETDARIDAWATVYYAQDSRLLRCIEEAAQAESDLRSMLDTPEHWEFPYEWTDHGVHIGSRAIVHRHAIYATLMGFLEREGVPGFEREWHGWAGEVLGQGDKSHERVESTYTSVYGDDGSEIEMLADAETVHTFPRYIGPTPKPSKAEVRKEQRRRKAELERDPSNSKAAQKMRKWRAARKANSDILKRASELS